MQLSLEQAARLAFTTIVEPGTSVVRKAVDALNGNWVAAYAYMADGKTHPAVEKVMIDNSLMPEYAKVADLVRSSGKNIFDFLSVDVPDDVYFMDDTNAFWPTDLLAGLGDFRPWLLFARGAKETFARWNEGVITITGARAATGYGEHVAMEFASGLGTVYDMAILSGTSYGIEGMSLRAALASTGRAIGLSAGGIMRPHPSGHQALIDRLCQQGLLLSEQAPDAMPTKYRFQAKHRLLAGLAHGSVVVEAGRNSGALKVAGWSKQIGKPTMAVPGPITSAASAGTNEMIRRGEATLVASVSDIIETTTTPR